MIPFINNLFLISIFSVFGCAVVLFIFTLFKTSICTKEQIESGNFKKEIGKILKLQSIFKTIGGFLIIAYVFYFSCLNPQHYIRIFMIILFIIFIMPKFKKNKNQESMEN